MRKKTPTSNTLIHNTHAYAMHIHLNTKYQNQIPNSGSQRMENNCSEIVHVEVEFRPVNQTPNATHQTLLTLTDTHIFENEKENRQ